MGAPNDTKFKVYDGATGEILGRTCSSWLKIIVFYIVYFTFLAGLFLGSVYVMQGMTGDERPNLQTRLQIPGMHSIPTLNPRKTEHHDRLKENDSILYKWKSDDETNYKFYSDLIGDAGLAQNLTGCNVAPYGWDTTSPCVYLRLNKVIDWTPVGILGKPNLEAMPYFTVDKPMVENAAYVRCGQMDTEGTEKNSLSFEYFGEGNNGGYLAGDRFPYKGKSNMESYTPPMVAVKINGLEDGLKYRVRCHTYAKNIVIDDRDNLGSFTFEVQHGDSEE